MVHFAAKSDDFSENNLKFREKRTPQNHTIAMVIEVCCHLISDNCTVITDWSMLSPDDWSILSLGHCMVIGV